MSTFDVIEQLRVEKKVKKRAVCKACGLKETAYTSWQTGRYDSYLKYLPQIADCLGVSVDYLLGKEERPTEPVLDDTEKIILDSFRALSAAGKAKAIQFLLNLCDGEGKS